MRTPQRYPLRPVADAEVVGDVPDMRTWWGRNAKAAGIVIGSALSTLLVGTGGLTGLARVAGIATTKDLTEVRGLVDGAMKVHGTAETVNGGRFERIEAALKELGKPKAEVTPKKKRKPVSEE